MKTKRVKSTSATNFLAKGLLPISFLIGGVIVILIGIFVGEKVAMGAALLLLFLPYVLEMLTSVCAPYSKVCYQFTEELEKDERRDIF